MEPQAAPSAITAPRSRRPCGATGRTPDTTRPSFTCAPARETELEQHGLKLDPIYLDLAAAFSSPTRWDFWCHNVSRIPGLKMIPAILTDRVAIRDQIVRNQHPQSTGAIEAQILQIKRRIGYRRALLRNKLRTDRLLNLIAIELNGYASVPFFLEAISAHAYEKGGHADPRHLVHHGPHFG